jgi:hypothetical protein
MPGIESLYRVVKNIFVKPVTVHVMGDSHAQVFEYMYNHPQRYPLKIASMQFCIVQGATNLGLANPHSQTQAMPLYAEHFKKVKKQDYIVFILGEVDCGFVIWYRAQKNNMSVDEQFELSLKNYTELLSKASGIVGNKIIVCSTPLPTITDKRDKVVGEVTNKRLEVNATQRERTDLTFRYNKGLKEICEKHKFIYLDYESVVLDTKTNLVSSLFLNENPLDHHLSNKAFSDILYPRLRNAIK